MSTCASSKKPFSFSSRLRKSVRLRDSSRVARIVENTNVVRMSDTDLSRRSLSCVVYSDEITATYISEP